MSANALAAELPPLIVDLDGTLTLTDTLHESALSAARRHPLRALCLPFWLGDGKAALKRRLATIAAVDARTLPYHRELLDWLTAQRDDGRRLILCTAADQSIAHAIAAHLGIFEAVMASDGQTNLGGRQKAQALEQRFGSSGFDYAGNAETDLHVWQRCRRAIVVNASTGLADKARTVCEVERVFPAPTQDFIAWIRLLRVHQWLKNLLLLVPLLAGHNFAHVGPWLLAIPMLLAFSLCASSVYLINDLLDLESDRRHPRKRHRPLANGPVPVWQAAVLAPMLLIASLALAAPIGVKFLACLALYFLLTCAYSILLKRLLLIDCLTLALLYTLRIVAGSAVTAQPLSSWLLAFSVFLFLSLAFVKRYAELEVQALGSEKIVHGRGYETSDAALIQNMGITAGYAAVVVLALYANSDAVLKLYDAPAWIWGTVLVTLFWISWMWMQAHRGRMHDDPVIFAIKDKVSLGAAAAFAAMVLIGSVGPPW